MPHSGAQASFIPLPRLWDNSLEKLRRRCHIDATEVIKYQYAVVSCGEDALFGHKAVVADIECT